MIVGWIFCISVYYELQQRDHEWLKVTQQDDLQMFSFAGLSPERDNEVNELPADPGPVPQRGVVVHPLPRDGDEGGVYILITHLHQNNAEIAMLCQNQE